MIGFIVTFVCGAIQIPFIEVFDSSSFVLGWCGAFLIVQCSIMYKK